MLNVILLVVIVAWLGTVCAAYAIGSLDMDKGGRKSRRQHPYPKIRRRRLDRVYQRMVTSLLDSDPVFRAKYGPIPDIEQIPVQAPEQPSTHPMERLANTGELQALAYTGDLAELARQTDAYKAQIDEGESA